jgi:hypothetical protein
MFVFSDPQIVILSCTVFLSPRLESLSETLAKLATSRLIEILNSGREGTGKYGRTLTLARFGGIDVSEILIKEGLA